MYVFYVLALYVYTAEITYWNHKNIKIKNNILVKRQKKMFSVLVHKTDLGMVYDKSDYYLQFSRIYKTQLN